MNRVYIERSLILTNVCSNSSVSASSENGDASRKSTRVELLKILEVFLSVCTLSTVNCYSVDASLEIFISRLSNKYLIVIRSIMDDICVNVFFFTTAGIDKCNLFFSSRAMSNIEKGPFV